MDEVPRNGADCTVAVLFRDMGMGKAAREIIRISVDPGTLSVLVRLVLLLMLCSIPRCCVVASRTERKALRCANDISFQTTIPLK